MRFDCKQKFVILPSSILLTYKIEFENIDVDVLSLNRIYNLTSYIVNIHFISWFN